MLTLRESIGLVMIVTAVTFVIAGSNITLYLIPVQETVSAALRRGAEKGR